MQTSLLTLFLGLTLSSLLALASSAQFATSSDVLKTLPYNFTLAALNTTLPNVNDTGTYASAHDDYFPSLGLVNGALRAYAGDGRWDTNASTITSGNPMNWISGSWWGALEHDQFTALPATQHDKYATLVTQGQDALWFLCPRGDYWNKNVVYYNISSPDKDSKDCYEVALQIVPLH